MIPPERLARIVIGKIGIIGCTVGAYLSYKAGPDYLGYFLMFTFLAILALLIVIVDVSKGDGPNDDDKPKPNLRFRH
jgi:uncharacterized membrane protein YfcA